MKRLYLDDVSLWWLHYNKNQAFIQWMSSGYKSVAAHKEFIRLYELCKRRKSYG